MNLMWDDFTFIILDISSASSTSVELLCFCVSNCVALRDFEIRTTTSEQFKNFPHPVFLLFRIKHLIKYSQAFVRMEKNTQKLKF